MLLNISTPEDKQINSDREINKILCKIEKKLRKAPCGLEEYNIRVFHNVKNITNDVCELISNHYLSVGWESVYCEITEKGVGIALLTTI